MTLRSPSSQTPQCDDVITLPTAAELLGVGPTTLKRWSDQGRIPHTRTPGGHRRFLRSVILDFRALVDPRAGGQGAQLPSAFATPSDRNGTEQAPLSLRMGEPAEWVDRANSLADADRMEGALNALRTSRRNFGELADSVLCDFVSGLRVRHRKGGLSEGSWRMLCRSLVRSVNRVSGRMRPRIGSPVALLASPGGCAGPLLVALAEGVLREAGFTVLEIGCVESPGVLEEVIAEQQPHQVVLLADAEARSADLVSRLQGVGRAAARRGAEVWLAGGAAWPLIDGARQFTSLASLSDLAVARSGADEGARAAR